MGEDFGTNFSSCFGTPGLSLLTLLPRERVQGRAELAKALSPALVATLRLQSPFGIVGTKTTSRMPEPRRDRLLISVADTALGTLRAIFVTCLGVFKANLGGC